MTKFKMAGAGALAGLVLLATTASASPINRPIVGYLLEVPGITTPVQAVAHNNPESWLWLCTDWSFDLDELRVQLPHVTSAPACTRGHDPIFVGRADHVWRAMQTYQHQR